MPSFHARGQVGDGELAFDQRELELEAQDDVQRIRHLVGGHADQGRLHADSSRADLRVTGSAAHRLGDHRERGLRPTWFSHSLLWDSWIDIECRGRGSCGRAPGDLALVDRVAVLVIAASSDHSPSP